MDTCNWDGYYFSIYSLNTAWNNVPGLYIFAKVDPAGYWKALYIGETESFSQRLSGHERWHEAIRLGMTHIHARGEGNYSNRLSIERHLRHRFNPPLNQQ